jgi:hypothetical protein
MALRINPPPSILTLRRYTELEDIQNMENFLSVKDCGAQGDGVTDDSAAIQRALDSKATRIYFPQGKYIINTPLILRRRGVMLEGENCGFNEDDGPNEYSGVALYKSSTTTRTVTVINQASEAVVINPNAILIIAIEQSYGTPYWVHNTTVKNIGFYGQDDSNPYGIYAYRVPNSVFEDLVFKRVRQAIYAYDTFLTRFVGLKVLFATYAGFQSEAATSNTWVNCYALQAPVGYLMFNTYSELSNCACDAASDIAYWIQGGQCTMTACGEEASSGLKILCGTPSPDNLAVANVDGFYPNTTAEITRTVAFNPSGPAASLSSSLLDYNYYGYGIVYLNGTRSRAIDEQGAKYIFNDRVIVDGGNPGTAGFPREIFGSINRQWDWHEVLYNDGSQTGGFTVGNAWLAYDGHNVTILMNLDLNGPAWGVDGFIVRDSIGYNYGVGTQNKNSQWGPGGQYKPYYTFNTSNWPINLSQFFGMFDFVVYNTATGTNYGKNTSYYVRYDSSQRAFQFADTTTQNLVDPKVAVGGANRRLLIHGRMPMSLP